MARLYRDIRGYAEGYAEIYRGRYIRGYAEMYRDVQGDIYGGMLRCTETYREIYTGVCRDVQG